MVETVSLLLCFSVFVRRSACQFSVDPDPSSSGVVGGPPLPVTTAAPSAITSTLAGPLDPGDVGTSELAITDTWTSSGPPVTDPTTPQSTTSSASSVLPPQGSTISDGDTTTSFPPSFTVTISSTSLDDPPVSRIASSTTKRLPGSTSGTDVHRSHSAKRTASPSTIVSTTMPYSFFTSNGHERSTTIPTFSTSALVPVIPTASAQASSKSSRLSTHSIVGIALGGVAAFLVLVLFYIIKRRRHLRNRAFLRLGEGI